MGQQPVPSLYIKFLKTFSHPLLLIVGFLLLPVKSYSLEGCFLVLIANELSLGSSFALTGVGGTVLLLVTWIIYGRKYKTLSEVFLNIGAIFIMMCTLPFYIEDHEMELQAPITFYEVFMFFLFVVLLYCFHVYVIHVYAKDGDHS